jgi:predicted RNase H-like HicB family nuclease
VRTVRVFYREEDDGAWIGTSPEAPGFVGHGDSYEQARDRSQEGLPWFLEDTSVLVAHIIRGGSPREEDGDTISEPRVSFGITMQATPRFFGRADPADAATAATTSR